MKKIKNVIDEMELNYDEFFELISDMIDDMLRNFPMSARDSMKYLADYYNISKKELIKFLTEKKSKYIVGNEIFGIIDGKEIKRTTFLSRYGVIIRKIINQIGFDDYDDISRILEFTQLHLEGGHKNV